MLIVYPLGWCMSSWAVLAMCSCQISQLWSALILIISTVEIRTVYY
jgi:hypothetical protein